MPFMETETVAIRLKTYRAALHQNQFEAAEEIGISVDELSNLERCCTDPKFSTLKKAADYMGISVQAMITPERTGTAVFGLLYRLGITPNYAGYFQTAQAIELCVQSTERLTLITKLVYAEVGERYRVGWTTVERNIRTVAKAAWKRSPETVERLLGYNPAGAPKTSEFIAALTARVSAGDYTFLDE